MAQEYDLVIIGGGMGGYVAAIRASQLGLKTALVENEKLGGTCLHKGCIPTKALLRSAEVYVTSQNSEKFGVITNEVSLNFEMVQKRKNDIIDQLHKGVQYLIHKGKIDVFYGYGRILGPSIFSPLPGAVSVEMNNGEENEILIPGNVIIATGSRPRILAGLPKNDPNIMNSDEALHMKELPKSIVIIGGGVIGVEWASMLADFGVRVTMLEAADQLIPEEDLDVTQELRKQLEAKGINIMTKAKVLVETIEQHKEARVIQAEIDGIIQTIEAERILVSVGRIGNTENLGLQNTSIEVNNHFIQVNSSYQTKESHIYAIGDVIGGYQLAHVASHEGIQAVEHIAGYANGVQSPLYHVPKCIYSSPEVASIGLTEKMARDQGMDYKVGKFPFNANGKALVYGQSEGFVKIVADKDTNDVLGVHMVGPHVTDLISEVALAQVLDATPWEIGNTIHPHPTLSETIGEAALDIEGIAIHI